MLRCLPDAEEKVQESVFNLKLVTSSTVALGRGEGAAAPGLPQAPYSTSQGAGAWPTPLYVIPSICIYFRSQRHMPTYTHTHSYMHTYTASSVYQMERQAGSQLDILPHAALPATAGFFSLLSSNKTAAGFKIYL